MLYRYVIISILSLAVSQTLSTVESWSRISLRKFERPLSLHIIVLSTPTDDNDHDHSVTPLADILHALVRMQQSCRHLAKCCYKQTTVRKHAGVVVAAVVAAAVDDVEVRFPWSSLDLLD